MFGMDAAAFGALDPNAKLAVIGAAMSAQESANAKALEKFRASKGGWTPGATAVAVGGVIVLTAVVGTAVYMICK